MCLQKSILSLLLCFTLLLTLAACGKGSSSDETVPSGNASPSGTVSPVSSDSADSSGSQEEGYVYVPSYFPLPDVGFLSDSNPIRDDILYYTSFEVDVDAGSYRYAPYAINLNTWEYEPADFPVSQEDSVSQIALLDQGGFALLLTRTADNISSRWLCLVDADGQAVLLQDVTDALFVESPLDETGGSPQSMCADSQGNLYVIVQSGFDTAIIVLDAEGREQFTLDVFDGCQGLYRGSDGSVYGLISSSLQKIDLETRDFGETLKNLPGDGADHIAADGDHSLLISSGNQLYSYDMDTQTSQSLLAWTDCNIDPQTISRIARLSDGRIVACTTVNQNNEWYYEAACLTETPRSQVKEKTTLTYGTLALDSTIAAQIVAFNKTNDSYHVEIREYGDGDPETGLLQLNADIISGHMPDILDLTSDRIDAANYISKGLLADLRPFLDSDPELSPEDFTENILNFYAQDDGLYGIPLFYYIHTLAGKTADVGSQMGWTVEDVLSLSASLPAGASLISNSSKESILKTLLTMGADTYIDWTTGVCHFDEEAFISLLEFANTFPAQDDVQWSYQTYTDIAQGKTRLVNLYLFDVFSYLYTEALFQGEPITCIGYPTAEGVGAAIIPWQSVAISSQSANQDGAWAFIRTLLGEEYQSSAFSTTLPVREDVLEALFREAQDPEIAGRRSQGQGDFSYEQEVATAAEIAAIRQIIDTAKPGSGCDTTIYNIILEETAPYFAGQKTAQAVAEIIQSRVQIYVSENQ